MKYLIFAFLIFGTQLSAMDHQQVNRKQFQEWLKNACGVTNPNQFLANGDNDRNYPFCWAAVKAIQKIEKQQRMNGGKS
jgi:hypothetical protein